MGCEEEPLRGFSVGGGLVGVHMTSGAAKTMCGEVSFLCNGRRCCGEGGARGEEELFQICSDRFDQGVTKRCRLS
jgi:hypothetical protein